MVDLVAGGPIRLMLASEQGRATAAWDVTTAVAVGRAATYGGGSETRGGGSDSPVRVAADNDNIERVQEFPSADSDNNRVVYPPSPSLSLSLYLSPSAAPSPPTPAYFSDVGRGLGAASAAMTTATRRPRLPPTRRRPSSSFLRCRPPFRRPRSQQGRRWLLVVSCPP